MTRKTAFLSHLVFSVLVLSIVLSVTLILWYPYPYSRVTGTVYVLKILVAVYLIAGPLLTLILFKPGKAGLKLDMYLVAIIQSALLLYGTYTLYQERPYYLVFVQDRFELLARGDIDQGKIPDAALFTKLWARPIYAVASMPADVKEQQRILEETLFFGKPDIHQRPEYWSPYETHLDKVRKRARPIKDLLERYPDKAAVINIAIQNNNGGESLTYLPIMGKKEVFSLLLDGATWAPVDVVSVDPWAKPSSPK
jgi:hypothetical protein